MKVNNILKKSLWAVGCLAVACGIVYLITFGSSPHKARTLTTKQGDVFSYYSYLYTRSFEVMACVQRHIEIYNGHRTSQPAIFTRDYEGSIDDPPLFTLAYEDSNVRVYFLTVEDFVGYVWKAKRTGHADYFDPDDKPAMAKITNNTKYSFLCPFLRQIL